jgi:DNA-directed RNA polymerase specialized sigma24 family protein
MAAEEPSLTDDERERVRSVLLFWAEVHPRPDRPVIQLADGSELTPRDIGRAMVEPRSRYESTLFRVFALTQREEPEVPRISLDVALGVFARDAERWASPDFPPDFLR